MGARQRIAEALTTAVTECRAALDAGRTPADERPNAMMFYVLADHLLVAVTSPDRPMSPAALVGGLRQLRERCQGSMESLRAQVDRALEEAENLDWDYRTA